MSLLAARGLIDHLRPLLGFSRVLQATLSVAQPFTVGLVALHGFPPLDRTVLALSAGWAGFLAVFAMNDLLDVDLDRARFDHLRGYDGFDVDSALARHPLAQRQIPPWLGVAWIGSLAAYALLGGYLLNPITPAMFVLAGLLQVLYCKLAPVTALKFLVSGLMVGVGGLAGWVALTPEIRPGEMAVLFAWLFFWEIGGRNIVNDFADVEEDGRLGIQSVPLVYGPAAAARLTFFCVVVATVLPLVLVPLSHLGALYALGVALAGWCLLVLPGWRLLLSPVPQSAMALFNRASFYPPAVLAALIGSLQLSI
ncbi:MAG: UbiA prenyltransferase family protein [Chloroflexota bacterium]